MQLAVVKVKFKEFVGEGEVLVIVGALGATESYTRPTDFDVEMFPTLSFAQREMIRVP